MIRRMSIRGKLFGIFLVILLLQFLILTLMGSTLFQRFYLSNKISELKSGAHTLQKVIQTDPETLYDEIDRLENRNSSIGLLSVNEDGSTSLEYYSRGRFHDGSKMDRGKSPEDLPATVEQPEELPKDGPWNGFPQPPEVRLNSKLLEAASTLSAGEMRVSEGNHFGGGEISLICSLGDGRILYMQTPKEYIQSTADQAVRYTTFLSAAILLIGSFFVFLLAGTVTRPIRKMRNVADKISRMDFSESCPVTSHDELGALSESINNMARELSSNIERLVAANEILQSDLERQRKTDLMRRQFIANVSHDFKTPLTLIVTYAEAMDGMPDPSEREECRQLIIDEGNKLSRMVGSLLKLSQLESGTAVLEPSVFCLGDILDSVLSAQKILAKSKHIRTEKDYSNEEIVRADYSKIGQVLQNLCDNAYKYAPEGALVRISVRPCGEDRCRIAVFNEGNPIPPEARENLFVSFYRADSSRNDGQSYGLGLAVVKAVMELHGERYGCENVPGGVEFWFTLPIIKLEDEC